MKKNELMQSVKIIILGLVVSLGVSYLYAWTAPPSNPPTNNVATPINVANTPQAKGGPVTDALLDINGTLSANNLVVWGNATINTNLILSSFTGSGNRNICANNENKLVICTTPSVSQYLLSVSKTGTGTGTVNSIPGGINCGNNCSQNYNNGTSVTLTATAQAGSTFAGWGGACSASGTNINCTVTMYQARDVSAVFSISIATKYPLAVSFTGTGGGSIVSTPPGITCGAGGSDCTFTYDTGTSVALTATPQLGSIFLGWSGACSGSVSPCTVTMYQARNVGAIFNTAPIYQLTVNYIGMGAVSGPNIDCAIAGFSYAGNVCSSYFQAGTIVSFDADPFPGNVFTGWTGACTNTTRTCTVTMSQSKSITAHFSPS